MLAPSAPRTPGVPAAPLSRRSRDVLPADILAMKMGDSSVGAGLERQIRFRVEGNGLPSQRTLVADTRLAADLLASPAGPYLRRQLMGAMASIDSDAARAVVKGFMLAPDDSAAAAGKVLSALDGPGDPYAPQFRAALRDRPKLQPLLNDVFDIISGRVASSSAWNSAGWITMTPSTSRAMLTAAGAYAPTPDEGGLRNAQAFGSWITTVVPHELQHSVTPPGRQYSRKRAWIEEGTAVLLAEGNVALERNQRAMGTSRHAYAGHLAHPPTFATGWGPLPPPVKLTKTEQAATAVRNQRNYHLSLDTLRELVMLAGGSFDSPAGLERTRDLLQEKNLAFVPGRLTDAIIERHALLPSVREHLRRRILTAVDDPGGVAALARDFNLVTRKPV